MDGRVPMHSKLRLGRSLLMALTFTAAATPALAQTHLTRVETLSHHLSVGDSISLVHADGETVTGRLVRVGDADLDIRVVSRSNPGGERRRLDLTIPLESIQSLERPRDSVRNGALLGAGIGAGVGAGMFIYATA